MIHLAFKKWAVKHCLAVKIGGVDSRMQIWGFGKVRNLLVQELFKLGGLGLQHWVYIYTNSPIT
jgi:hypothetical protein